MTATYGSLVDRAWMHLRTGNEHVLTGRLDDVVAARTAAADFYGLLEAIRANAWSLIAPSRLAGLAATAHPDATEAAAVELLQALPHRPDDLVAHADAPGPLRPWLLASQSLRAAADLLSSHTTITGGARTPDAPRLWDEASRAAALGRLGGFTVTVLAVEDTLGLRCGQAGVPWETVRRWLHTLEEARELARDLARRVAAPTGSPDALATLPAASRQVRVGRPTEELGDRVARLRRMAWSVRETPDYSIGTLTAITRVGLACAVHTAAFHGIDVRSAGLSDPAVRHIGSWLRLLADLRDYRGTGTSPKHALEDARAIRRLLDDVAPWREVAGDRGSSADPGTREIGGVLHGACAASVQAAEWNAATFSRLAHSGMVYLHAADLTGDDLTDAPELAATALRHPLSLVAAPRRRTDATTARFADVSQSRPPWLATGPEHSQPVVESRGSDRALTRSAVARA